ncbi:hypothetical protein T10_6669 [Trichinella papuae]|uniref:Uncharacterized protein n=1 Tax=Trichinella papuae TaxID=268474 RepID=A0A0V1M7X7_9BILA|nr:hypothetical protein T10_4353 [Trichinella papuae]KRZ66276.1 hypothetical protein T10_8557 [Trichinella papuae]KRZ67751.1 hypothetical protein T10_11416 [Trichinella papuae]KRZ67779.1 hypothetical protein T10_6669 [Trichinella papuae]
MEISEEKRNTGIFCSYSRVASHLFECQALCDPDCGFFSVSSPALSLNNTCRRLICLAQESPRTVADATRQASVSDENITISLIYYPGPFKYPKLYYH